jgi:predicted NAD/FAD-binding protein
MTQQTRRSEMATEQDLHTVRGLAEDYERVESVRLEDGEIVVRGHGVTERFDTAEEACSAIRASWVQS